MNREPFKVGDFIQHFKREDKPFDFNHLYQVIGVDVLHTETGERLLVYKALYGNCETFARPMSMAMSEVDKEKYPNYKQVYRLEKVTDEVILGRIARLLEES